MLANLLEDMSNQRMSQMPQMPNISSELKSIPGPIPAWGQSRPESGGNLQALIPLLLGGGGGGGAAPAGGGPNKWIARALNITNSPMAWQDELHALMMRESGGNPRAYNDTAVASGQHAQGLFQTIPSTFDAYNIDRLGGIYNPVANAVAAIRYIKSRYGNPMNLPSSGGY